MKHTRVYRWTIGADYGGEERVECDENSEVSTSEALLWDRLRRRSRVGSLPPGTRSARFIRIEEGGAS